MGNGSRSHHLLRHALPEGDVKEHFGSNEPKEITREINRLGQRDLQAKFRVVYGTQTFSNNNNWLRRKLLEAAGLQTPKAIARGRPSAKQARTLSQGDVADDSPTVSRSDSFSSHEGDVQPSSPIVGVIRRTKRARKPKQFDDMLVMNQATGHAASDDEDEGSDPKMSGSSSKRIRRELQADCTLLTCSSGTLMATEDLMWTPSKIYKTGHIITSIAPTTPDLPIMRRQMAGYGEATAAAAAASLLGAANVLNCAPAAAAADEGDLSLPSWARLPSNDRSASCDLDDISAQDSRSSGTLACSGFEAMPYESPMMGPGTPPRIVASASAASVTMLHDSPFAAAFGQSMVVSHGLAATATDNKSLMPLNVPADFDCFAIAPPQPTGADAALPLAAFDKGAFRVADSCASEMSVLDIFLEELSSQQEMTHDLSHLAPLVALDSLWDMDGM